ncbi:MAG: hypothetical protein RR482_10035, partial [Clostridia bacterium]
TTLSAATVDIAATLAGSKLVAKPGEKVELTCTIKNDGSVKYNKLKIADQTLGDIASGITLAAGKTHTEKKTIVVNGTGTYVFKITGIDSSGNELSILSNEVTIQTTDDIKPLKLELTIEPDRDWIYDLNAEAIFTVKLRNNGEMAVKNVEIMAVDKTIKRIDEIKAGEEITFAKQVRVSEGGQFQFVAVAKDSVGATQKFASNIQQISYKAPAPTPSPTPMPTPAPTATAAPDPTWAMAPEDGGQQDGTGFGTILLYVLAGLLIIIIGGVVAMFMLDRRRVEKPTRGNNGHTSQNVSVIDSMERSSRRDYARAPHRGGRSARVVQEQQPYESERISTARPARPVRRPEPEAEDWQEIPETPAHDYVRPAEAELMVHDIAEETAEEPVEATVQKTDWQEQV